MKPRWSILRWILPATGGLVVALVVFFDSSTSGVAEAANGDVAGPYGRLLSEWTTGYWCWRVLYTLLSGAAVTFPAFIAAGVPSQDNRRQVVAAIAAATIAITTFMQAGEKATAHEHAYVCMELADAAYHSGRIDIHQLGSRAERCAAYIDYNYVDVQKGESRNELSNLDTHGETPTQRPAPP